MTVSIRTAVPGDGAVLHGMIRELAVSHGNEKYFQTQPGDLDRALADRNGIVAALIAEADGRPAGCAIIYRSFSTFRGRETLHLEDICVLPEFRRRGVASALMRAVAREAAARGVPAVSWLMMAWNGGARTLYEGLGAEIEEGCCVWRLHGDALERLAK